MGRPRKPIAQCLIFRQIGMTMEQWAWVEGELGNKVSEGLGAPLRKMVMERVVAERLAENDLKNGENRSKAATFHDFQRVFDQYFDVFRAGFEGLRVGDCEMQEISTPFKGLVQKITGKAAFEEEVQNFILTKLTEIAE